MKITIYELLGLIKDGKAPKKISRERLGFVKDYKLNSHTATVCRTYESEDGTFLMDLVKIDDEVIILDEEDEFIDIEELDLEQYYSIEDSSLKYDVIATINDIIKNQKKIIERLSNERNQI